MAHVLSEQLRAILSPFWARNTVLRRPSFHHIRGISTTSSQKCLDQQASIKTATSIQTSYGQPFSSTHPHLMKEGEVTPGLSSDEYCSRRHRLMELLTQQMAAAQPRHHVVIVPAARMAYLSEDIPHPFRQNTDLLYLSGCQEPDTVLVLHSVPGRPAPAHTSALFVQRNTAHRQLWEGGCTGPAAAPQLLGVDEARAAAELQRYLECLAADFAGARAAVWYDFQADLQAPLNATVRDFVGALSGAGLESPRRAVQSLRLLKSPAEQRLMRRAARCAAAAIRDAMAASRPGVGEHELYARVDFGARMRGAERLAYPPVVAGGERTNVIHYTHNNRTVEDGQLVLMDAGCELHGYCSDITRTWPVNGTFSSDQLLLYTTLLEVQEALIEVVRTSRPTLDGLYGHMFRMLSERLAHLGLVGFNREKGELFRSVQRFCPHHVGHYLGMDVHDTGLMPKNRPLQPGMVITVEPGLYVSPSDTNCSEGFRGMGFRIEDDILITEEGCEVLSADCPKTVEAIQAAVGSGAHLPTCV
ncbi:xaa-Pro aminopeptidase 3-like isoform X2 [Pollicipes pollicipes]|uniref:xaa-Pro aminopeptidase 3-like isoform X2 n=1 Tax=Pollicipes pollicipes TaxID=41117 RepID=UPI0018854A0F|nr:xaa-Pro aminopeptidase 3-like isoform X2 [Pollicipes pollicipes]